MREITTLSDGSFIYYDQGDIDHWRVTYKSKDGNFKTSYRDSTMFRKFIEMAGNTSNDKVYNDLLMIHNETEKNVETGLLALIKRIAKTYPAFMQNMAERFFTLFYYMMVSEENKANTITGKKIKMHGVHLLFKNNYTPEFSANLSRTLSANNILKQCAEFGF